MTSSAVYPKAFPCQFYWFYILGKYLPFKVSATMTLGFPFFNLNLSRVGIISVKSCPLMTRVSHPKASNFPAIAFTSLPCIVY